MQIYMYSLERLVSAMPLSIGAFMQYRFIGCGVLQSRLRNLMYNSQRLSFGPFLIRRYWSKLYDTDILLRVSSGRTTITSMLRCSERIAWKA